MARAGTTVTALLLLAGLSGCAGHLPSFNPFGGGTPDPAVVLENQGKFREATELRRQELAAAEATHADDDPAIGDALDRLGYDELADAIPSSLFRHETERAQIVLKEADGVLARAVAIDLKAYGPDDLHVAVATRHLAAVRVFDGHPDQGEVLYRQSIAIYEKRKGPNATEIADILADAESLFYAPERHDELERNLKRVIAIRETAYGSDSARVADGLDRLAYFYENYGKRPDLEEPVAKRAFDIREKTAAPDSLALAQSILTLASVYVSEGRLDEAEALYKRAVAIDQKREGGDAINVAIDLNALAHTYEAEGRGQDAKEVYQQILPIFEKHFGPEDGDVALALEEIAGIDMSQGRFDEAKALLDRVQKFAARREARQSKNYVDGDAQLANSYTQLYLAEGKPAEADSAFQIILAVAARHTTEPSGPYSDTDVNGPVRAQLFDLHARIYQAENRLPQAMVESRAALRIVAIRASRVTGQRSAGVLVERRSWRGVFVRNVELSESLALRDATARPTLTDTAFETAQLAEASSTEAAVAGMAARFASGTDALAAAVRDRQDTQGEWQRLDLEQAKATALPPDQRDARADSERHVQIAALERRLDAFDAQLARDFPQYAEIANPQPVPLAAAQKLLGPQEALLTYLVGDQASFLWVVRRDRATLLRLSIGRKELDAAIDKLRAGLDPTRSNITSTSDIPPFDVAAALELDQRIFAPAEPFLAGARTVFVVLDGALQSLPLGVLVTARPPRPIANFKDYSGVSWLTRRYAFTVLPAVSSLRALRLFTRAAHGTEPFAGFGDPVFDGTAGTARGVALKQVFRGGGVDIAELRKLPRLPDTADELREEARILNAPPQSVRLGKDATVTAVKNAQLGDTRIIAFATHGLVAGDLPALAEPALALTPPAEPSAEDQGLLTASAVTQLKLNADWIVLSACNTAAPDGSVGADGLSGLTKAFFYAGARSALISHWPVDSASTVELTTGTFAAIEADRSIGRAEALQHSMLAMIAKAGADPAISYRAHPMFWAPFVVVGEGGAGR
jgi:CHAT domain-containing protein